MQSKKILWFTWKDWKHPDAGGAERTNMELATRFVKEGHEVHMITQEYGNAPKEEYLDGVYVLRIGKNRYAHTFLALFHYLRYLRGRYDVIIEEVNTAPYFVTLLRGPEKGYLLFHQLAGIVWPYETIWPLSWLGQYLLEPVALWLLTLRKTPTITISKSTELDLQRYGFNSNNISIIQNGITFDPTIVKTVKKSKEFTCLYFGSKRRMKRPDHTILAFIEFIKMGGKGKLIVAGGGANEDFARLKSLIPAQYASLIEFTGRVDEQTKLELFKSAHVFVFCSVKEGWGIVVTEAAICKTPSIVYDVDGLRDVVINNKTGYIVPNNDIKAVAEKMVFLYKNPDKAIELGENARKHHKDWTYDKMYNQFKETVFNEDD